MELNAMLEYYKETEGKYLELHKKVAEQIINEYKKIGSYHKCDDNPLEFLLFNYLYLKKKNKHQKLETLLDKYHFNYVTSIHKALYDLLIDKEERSILWPGMIRVENDNLLYKVKTNIGIIRVYKASEMFKNSKSFYIFNRFLKKVVMIEFMISWMIIEIIKQFYHMMIIYLWEGTFILI